MRKYYSGEILVCGVLGRYVSKIIVEITGTLRLNRCTLFMYLQRNSLFRAARIVNFEGILGFSVPSII